jgi:two-component system response regulator PilR (NtrC family)
LFIEFFGHKKGSFTGAINDKTGLFHAAKGGILFLDEVAGCFVGV